MLVKHTHTHTLDFLCVVGLMLTCIACAYSFTEHFMDSAKENKIKCSQHAQFPVTLCSAATATATATTAPKKTEMHAFRANSTCLCSDVFCISRGMDASCCIAYVLCSCTRFYYVPHLMENNSVSLWRFFSIQIGHTTMQLRYTVECLKKDNLIYSLMSQIHFSGLNSLSLSWMPNSLSMHNLCALFLCFSFQSFISMPTFYRGDRARKQKKTLCENSNT